MDEDRLATAVDDLRVTLRDMNARQERVLREVVAAIVDMRAEIRANTEATWKMLDRFGEGPTPAS